MTYEEEQKLLIELSNYSPEKLMLWFSDAANIEKLNNIKDLDSRQEAIIKNKMEKLHE